MCAVAVAPSVYACTTPFIYQFLNEPIATTRSQGFVALGRLSHDGNTLEVTTTFQGDPPDRVDLVRDSAPPGCWRLRETGDEVLVFGRVEAGVYIAEESIQVDDDKERRAVATLMSEKSWPSPVLVGEIQRAACKPKFGDGLVLAVVEYDLEPTGDLRSVVVRETPVLGLATYKAVSEAALALVSSSKTSLDPGSGRVIVELTCR